MVTHVPNGIDAGTRSWRNKRKCAKLTPQQADAIFFVKPGGKSKAAKEFCKDCPVIDKCLQENLEVITPGFWAGTTEDERRRMVAFLGLMPSELDDFMPPEPTRLDRQLRPVRRDPNILGDPLYGLDGPSMEEELRMYGM